MATHSSILGWIISWTEKPGRLQSTGLQKSWRWLSDSATSFCSALHPFCAGFSHHALWSPNSHRILRVHIQVPGRNRSRDEGLLFVFFFPLLKLCCFTWEGHPPSIHIPSTTTMSSDHIELWGRLQTVILVEHIVSTNEENLEFFLNWTEY